LTIDGIVTVIGSVITLLGMGVTIWQASQARNYKNQIKFDIRKITLTKVNERLKRAQDEIRRLPTNIQGVPRGVRPIELIQKIREQFDIALGSLSSTGPDASVRELLVQAQGNINTYEISWNEGNPNAPEVHHLQARVQDAISTLSTTIFQMEGNV